MHHLSAPLVPLRRREYRPLQSRSLVVVGLLASLLLGGCAEWVRKQTGDLIRAGEYEAAAKEIQAGLERYPNDLTMRAGQIKLKDDLLTAITRQIVQLRQSNRLEEAIQLLDRAEKLHLNSAELGKLRFALEQDQQVSRTAKQVQEWLQEGKPAQAMQAVETHLRTWPQNRTLLSLQKQVQTLLQTQDPLLGQQRRLSETRPISLEFKNAPLGSVLEAITRDSGINFILDRDIKQDGRVNIFLRQARVDEAIDLVLSSQGLARRVVDPKTLLIFSNTQEKVREHQEVVVRVFYLAHAEAKTTAQLLRSMLKINEPFVDERANMLALRDTPDNVALAERLVAVHDSPDAEVMLDVEVLEVSSSGLLNLGINFPDTLTLTPLNSAGASTGLKLNDLRGLNSSLVGAAVSPLTINLRRELGDAQVLANPSIRAKNREKAKILIGDKVPVVTTSSSATGIVGQNVNYLDVGLKLEVEPLIAPNAEITLQLALEVSNITREISTGNGGTAYQIGTRNASTTLRLQDGETQILGGLINRSEKSSSARIPGLGDLPVLGRLFGTQQDSRSQNELVLAITPRILRGARNTDLMQAWMSAGTEMMPRARAIYPLSPGQSMAIGPPLLGINPPVSTPPAPPSQSPKPLGQAPIGPPLPNNNPPLAAPPAHPRPSHLVSASGTVSAPAISPALRWEGPNQVQAGQEIRLKLMLSSPIPLLLVPLDISYPASAFEVLEVNQGGLMRSDGGEASFAQAVNRSEGRISASSMRVHNKGVTGEGSIVELRLRAKQVGQHALALGAFAPISDVPSAPWPPLSPLTIEVVAPTDASVIQRMTDSSTGQAKP